MQVQISYNKHVIYGLTDDNMNFQKYVILNKMTCQVKKTSFENHNSALKPTPPERTVKVSWKCGSDFKHQASA